MSRWKAEIVNTPDGRFTFLFHECRTVGGVHLALDYLFCPWCGYKVPKRVLSKVDELNSQLDAEDKRSGT